MGIILVGTVLSVGTVAAATVCSVGIVVGIYRPSFIGIGWRNPADTKDYWYRLYYISRYHKCNFWYWLNYVSQHQ
jgi:hypothetical protein